MVVVIRILLAIAVSTAFTLALVLLARATRKQHCLRGTPDVEPTYITTVGTLYGIFVAFMIFTVWIGDSITRSAATCALSPAPFTRAERLFLTQHH